MLKKILGLTAALSIGLMMSSCIINNSDDDNARSDVDFESYSDYALIVKNNNSKKNMVLFKGEPSQKNIIGGVKAGSTTNIKKTSLFNATEDFMIFVITEDDYIEYKEKLEKVSPYCTFYAVNNTDSTNDYVYEISNVLGGKYKMILNNGTKYNVEFRNKSADNGEVLACALANSYEKTYALAEGEYMIFPVFRKFEKKSGEIYSVFPMYQTGKLAGEAISMEFSLDEETTEVQFNAKDWVDNIKFVPSAAYISITNNSDQGLQFFKSAMGTPEITSAGGKRINTGKTLIYPVNMTQITKSEYAGSMKISGYRCATNRVNDIYLNGDKANVVEYVAGNMYQYSIGGGVATDYVVTNPKMTEETDYYSLEGTPIDWSNME